MNRKLKIEDGELQGFVSMSIVPADFIIYSPPPLQAAALAETKSSISRTRNESSMPNPGFESSMVLTIFVLLTALFFMGFFTVYLRCVSSRRRSRRAANFISNIRLQQLAAASSSLSNNPATSKEDLGLDPIVIASLPILPYIMNINNGSSILEVKDDCVICLCEYEEGEMVKMIPYCGHLFHHECVDLWFKSHSSCPLCRSTQLFPPAPEKKQEEEEEKQEDDELRSRVAVILKRAYSFSAGDGCNLSLSILLLGDQEVMLKRSSSWRT